jgi:hypothetical protein
MTSRIMTVNFFLIKVFSAQFSRLIASFVGVSVTDYGIMAGNIARQMSQFTKIAYRCCKIQLEVELDL